MVKPTTPIVDPQQEALFREVEEDLRHDRLVALWKRFGGLVLAGAVLLVVAVAGAQGWRAWQADRQVEAAAAFEAADALIARGDRDGAQAALARVADEGVSGIAPLAALRRAALLAEDGKTAEAVAAYRALIDKRGVDPVFRDTARLLAALHGLALLPANEIESLLTPLRGGESPWRPLAEEIAAQAALQGGDRDTGLTLLAGLSEDRMAPPDLRERAGALLEALGGAPASAAPASAAPAPAAPGDSAPAAADAPATGRTSP
ncbi:tetratricopeptide repeat protein [Pararhodospirillum oryzae]|uniref:Ancillary SecYEG translocon subunit/Cell division coordinator CpoB TPR domain-containing protein n=1 Tax=Pararhodospirillum oryzae TaxID=478448 RepID=A0A512HAJ2_9PROT|nr:tetratricopeptide repeat protein [Pararhodospirillum oryzae]GEO82455.1 hypothetical protein ROR02_25860 [Pararhodospirillum oryzae]